MKHFILLAAAFTALVVAAPTASNDANHPVSTNDSNSTIIPLYPKIPRPVFKGLCDACTMPRHRDPEGCLRHCWGDNPGVYIPDDAPRPIYTEPPDLCARCSTMLEGMWRTNCFRGCEKKKVLLRVAAMPTASVAASLEHNKDFGLAALVPRDEIKPAFSRNLDLKVGKLKEHIYDVGRMHAKILATKPDVGTYPPPSVEFVDDFLTTWLKMHNLFWPSLTEQTDTQLAQLMTHVISERNEPNTLWAQRFRIFFSMQVADEMNDFAKDESDEDTELVEEYLKKAWDETFTQ
ncbi:hypothetical protein EJ07DRAFT_176763 [Lizonia empirigonia]|nr:hypothetical protein EJ07DRAFT_176763 [Lizonia empirigonia]